MKANYQLGDDDRYPDNNKVNFKTILGCAAFMLIVWIPIGFFIFQWLK